MAHASTTATSSGAERRKAAPNGDIRLNGAATTDRTQAGSDQKEHDFFWTYTEEPHRTRRLAIIKAHPEVTTALTSLPWVQC
jgi:sphingolipid 4-desaturase/C4-monooxygenase